MLLKASVAALSVVNESGSNKSPLRQRTQNTRGTLPRKSIGAVMLVSGIVVEKEDVRLAFRYGLEKEPTRPALHMQS
jgi:hypothetical protein